MDKSSSNLWTLVVFLAIASKFAASFNASYHFGEINNKLTQLQQSLEVFDVLTERDESVLAHRIEVKDLNETNVKLKNLVDKMDSLALVETKLHVLEGKLNALTATVSNCRVEVMESKCDENVKMNETQVQLKNLVDKAALFASVETKLNALEGTLNSMATAVTAVSLQLHRLMDKESKCAENVVLQRNETNIKLKNLEDKMDSIAGKSNTPEGKPTNFDADNKGTLSNPLSSCAALPLSRGSGVYYIQLIGLTSPLSVYCLTDPNGGLPWTVVQRRVDNTVNFYRDWAEYQKGFGHLQNNFFIGLNKLHLLTALGEPQELWVKLSDFDDITAHAYYDRFAIGNETMEYPLEVLGNHTGDAGDSLNIHKSMKFSTYDNDNDEAEGNCAEEFKSAWWFRSCHYCQLNGNYGSNEIGGGIFWGGFPRSHTRLKYAHMAIRPVRKELAFTESNN